MKKVALYIALGVIYITLCWLLPEWIDIPDVIIGVILIIIYIGGIFLIEHFFSYDDVEVLIRNIIKEMKEEGYECAKDEGVLQYSVNGRKYRAYFWHTGHNTFRTEIIDYALIDENWNDISFQGKSVLANYVNQNCPHSTIVASDKGIVCSHVTAISNAKDFLKSALISRDVINEALEKSSDILPYIKRDFPLQNEVKHIGFNSGQ